MGDLVIVSMHEKGFPQADMYLGMAETSAFEFEGICPTPDDFFTMKIGDTLDQAKAKAAERWPGAKIVDAAEPDESDEDDDDRNECPLCGLSEPHNHYM